ncbi:hypothetical protein CBM2609_B30007 [Cupriavidus taiwanensis]|nr:hypothetical protein CBM2604_B40007 [Cupriavidus taiwanensis]SOZ32315.1 hypothetical protein CBM2609_B30007 [Cupriavidus taiwanensis]SOZ47908.1 hypothetical protein CBM2610_B30007 [Cupriavidus taiwanensis]
MQLCCRQSWYRPSPDLWQIALARHAFYIYRKSALLCCLLHLRHCIWLTPYT